MEIIDKNTRDIMLDLIKDLSSFAGNSFLPCAAPIVKWITDSTGLIDDTEDAYRNEQFEKLRKQLENLSQLSNELKNENKKYEMYRNYYTVEQDITNQFTFYMAFLTTKKEVKKTRFLDHFNATKGDKNLHTLYDGVTGNIPGESILEIIMNCENKKRRAVESFCHFVNNLFCMGLIALLGHARLKGFGEEEKLLQEWKEKMKTVQKKMNDVIEDCIVSFPKLAEQDSHSVVRDNSGLSCPDLAQTILDKLKERYDWVSWSVRVFYSPKCCLDKWAKLICCLAVDFHCLKGNSSFQVPSSEDRLNVVVSYSSSPEPVNRERVSELIQGQKKVSVVSTAELLFSELPGDCMVHTIKTRELAVCSSFGPELHYWKKHDKVYVCVHSA